MTNKWVRVWILNKAEKAALQPQQNCKTISKEFIPTFEVSYAYSFHALIVSFFKEQKLFSKMLEQIKATIFVT